jgi:glycosyltransferase involved in cell wall biosynthesis
MNELPLVSLLMTAYNRETYIGFAIESIIASTYKNWELIIVDDGSKDKTLEIALQYAEKDKRISIYTNEKNLGDYPNRNKAASYAKGKYIKYIDADDAIYYWGLQVEVEMMERYPEAAYGLDSIEQDDEKMYPYLLSPSQAYISYYIRGSGIFDKAPTSCIIKNEVFQKVNGFKPLRMVGDAELWHRLSLQYPVLAMPHGIIWSRGHSDSESGKLMSKPSILYHYLLVRRQYLTNENCPLPLNQRKKSLGAIVRHQLRILSKLLMTGRFSTLRQIRETDRISILELVKLQIGN